MQPDRPDRSFLTRFAWLSIAAAVVTIGLKAVAYLLTGSVGLLSDSLESIVNLAGALMALAMLTVAARPPDVTHPYGHSKAEYLSSSVEGMLILFAAGAIAVAAVRRLITPQPLEQIGLGVVVSIAAALVNLAAAVVLLRVGRKHNSISLVANAHHLLTDVWTSAGVVAGVALVAVTGVQRIDPIVALVVAANIVWSGARIVRDSVHGLMDTALPAAEQRTVETILEQHAGSGVRHHALRTRRSGAHRFVSLHVLVPGALTVEAGHHLAEHIEKDIRAALPGTTVLTHLEPDGGSLALDEMN
jgi:cation diffusion facilitator family transporter